MSGKVKVSQVWLGSPGVKMDEHFMDAHFQSILLCALSGLLRGNEPVTI